MPKISIIVSSDMYYPSCYIFFLQKSKKLYFHLCENLFCFLTTITTVIMITTITTIIIIETIKATFVWCPPVYIGVYIPGLN